jgi:hypothetical protein
MPFELKAALGLDQSAYIAGFEQAKGVARNFGRDIGSHIGGELSALKGQFAAAFGVAAITHLGKEIIEIGGHIRDMADRTNLSVRMVQALDYAAGQTGSSFDAMANAMKKIAIARTEALKAPGEQRDAFKDFGITLQEIKAARPEGLFIDISDAIKKAGDSTEYTASLVKLMGKNADELVPAMKQGVGEMIAEFDKLGLAIDEKVINKLDEMGDSMDRVARQMKKGMAEFFINTIQGLDNFGRLIDKLDDLTSFDPQTRARARKSLMEDFYGVGESKEEVKRMQAELDRKDAARDKQKKDEIEQATNRVIDFDRKKTGGIERAFSSGQTFDALARIGGGVGGSENRAQYQLGQQILMSVNKMVELMQGNFGADQMSSLL